MNFNQTFENRRKKVDKILKSNLPNLGYSELLREAMAYPILNGGKRLRPILLWASYEVFSNEFDACIEKFLVAIECVHCFSLVHDDLPAMDDDDLRRGKPTTHKVFGEALGILVGDALLNFAYESGLSTLDDEKNLKNKIAALQILAKATGHRGMIVGQVLDMKQDLPSEDDISLMYSLKTGALIKASMLMGAALGKAKSHEMTKISKIADKIGLAFQIRDDILDMIGDEKLIGKQVGSDLVNEKMTLGQFYGIEKSKVIIEKLTDEALDLLREIEGNTEFIEDLVKYLVDREF